jgi:hypothetical protein
MIHYAKGDKATAAERDSERGQPSWWRGVATFRPFIKDKKEVMNENNLWLLTLSLITNCLVGSRC